MPRAVLIVNPRSGPDGMGLEELVAEAERRGIEVRRCGLDGDLRELAEGAADEGAEVIGMAGGDGSLGVVAGVAARRGMAFVPVPFGTRNHFARDLGFDPADVAGGIAAFGGPERRVDLGSVNGRAFVNNVSLGVYAAAVHDPRYAKRRDIAFRRMLGAGLRLRRRPLRLRVDVDGTPRPRNVLVLLVGNNDYRLTSLADVASETLRERLDGGELRVYAIERRGWLGLAGLVARRLFGRLRRDTRGWEEWSCGRLRVESRASRLKAAIDGDPVVLETPIEVEIRPRALRVRVPPR